MLAQSITASVTAIHVASQLSSPLHPIHTRGHPAPGGACQDADSSQGVGWAFSVRQGAQRFGDSGEART
eukprot:7319045-Prymnesium_polylepis.1